ncbi:hypothetical protein [Pontiella sp.]|uniref:hypothetical protein n=1 Tax=Pontiella sp. TaxID=2837462 RepID=UPI0035622D1D
MNNSHPSKSGAALVIALGFLAVLTLLVVAYTAQTRTDRLSGRAFVSTAAARHLLHTAMARAMEDLDSAVGAGYPDNLLAMGSVGDSDSLLSDSLDFGMQEDFFQIGNSNIALAFDDALATSRWQTVSIGDEVVGRVGYVVINSSGFLDANEVGSATNSAGYIERATGLSPAEIQLAKGRDVISEFNSTASMLPHIAIDSPGGTLRAATDPNLTPGLAFVRNRDRSWRRFETLHDVLQLNQDPACSADIVAADAMASFCTFSYTPEPDDGRTFMGTNSASLAEDAIRTELKKNGAINADYVINQLIDYLDTDTIPEDVDASVEPVPLINEVALTCDFSFFPLIEMVEDDEGNEVPEVVSITITNSYSVEIEVWYPFTGYENETAYQIKVENDPIGTLPNDLFDQPEDWVGRIEIPSFSTLPGALPADLPLNEGTYESYVEDSDELLGMFDEMLTDIEFPLIECIESGGTVVDRVENLTLPLSEAVGNTLIPQIESMISNLFSAADAEIVSNRFIVSMSCIDPRLNWNGLLASQWESDWAAGMMNEDTTVSAGSMGEVNYSLISAVVTPDDTDAPKIFVRNTDEIDSPWEFTYFLYDLEKPWQTMQMLEAFDEDNTRYIMQNLSPFPQGEKPRHGLVNPHSPHPNVLAAVFMGIPLDEFNGTDTHYLDEPKAAAKVAALFADWMQNSESIAATGWPVGATGIGDGFNLDNLGETIGSTDPWVLEAAFRNTYELFNPRDTLYTILLAAQAGTDIDGDGMVSDEEVRATQQAIAYVWRDPQTEQAAIVFWGLADTLQTFSESGRRWRDLLQAFEP